MAPEKIGKSRASANKKNAEVGGNAEEKEVGTISGSQILLRSLTRR